MALMLRKYIEQIFLPPILQGHVLSLLSNNVNEMLSNITNYYKLIKHTTELNAEYMCNINMSTYTY